VKNDNIFSGELISLLNQKTALFIKYASLTESLRKKIEARDTEDLENLLEERLRLMRRIDQLDFQMEQQQTFDQENINETKVNYRNLYETIKKAERLNNDCRRSTINVLEYLRNDLSHVSDVQHGFKGYHAKPTHSPRFLDIQS